MALELIEISDISAKIGLSSPVDGVLVYSSSSTTAERIPKRPFRSSHFALMICNEGKLVLKVNFDTVDLNKNELIIIAPSAIREIQIDDKTQLIALFFSSEFLFKSGIYQKNLEMFQSIGQDFKAYFKSQAKEIIEVSKIIQVLFNLISRKVTGTVEKEMIALLFQSCMLQLNAIHKVSSDIVISKANSRKDDLTVKFLNLLSKNYRKEREVIFYAQQLFVNPKYLSQALLTKTGKTARQYIVDMVILDAKVLLDDPTLSIVQISELLNFSDQFHFSHFFKKYTGKTPSSYRSFS
jgi:AraC family transcriptional activator of pobA